MIVEIGIAIGIEIGTFREKFDCDFDPDFDFGTVRSDRQVMSFAAVHTKFGSFVKIWAPQGI